LSIQLELLSANNFHVLLELFVIQVQQHQTGLIVLQVMLVLKVQALAQH
jgi:hypothetical protein